MGVITIRILLVNKYHYLKGGSERYEFELARLLTTHGHEVGFFSMHDEQNLPSEFASFFVVNRDYRTGGLMTKMREAGRIIYSREARQNLARLVESFRPDLVHLHNIYHQLTPSIIWELYKRRIPTVLTLHDYKLACPSYEFLDCEGHLCTRCADGSIWPVLTGKCGKGGKASGAILFAEAIFHRWAGSYRRMVSAFIAPSRFMLEQLTRAGVVPAERLHHIPNFIDCCDYEVSWEDKGYFLYAGRLARSKGVMTLVKAAAGLPDCRLKIAGAGEEAERIAASCRDTGGRLEMLGYCEQDRLRGLISGARAVIVPSEWFENCPMIVLEAFACGKPVIASAIGGLPELVLPEETGFLFIPGDVEDLRKRLIDSMTKVDDLKRMGENARKIVEASYSPEMHIDALMSLYTRSEVMMKKMSLRPPSRWLCWS